jgi:trk system potassium uptake protein TrkH
MKQIQKIYKKLSFFDYLFSLNAAEFAVISFVIVSLIGGLLLFYTEKDKNFFDDIPTHSEVRIQHLYGNTSYNTVHTRVTRIQYHGINFVDAVFTSVSALCVTGLTTVDFSGFSLQGQIVVMILIQLGGFGIVVFSAMLAISIFKGISHRGSFKKLIADTVDSQDRYAVDMLRYIFLYTVIFEGTGIVVMGSYLSYCISPDLIGGTNPWWWAAFHAVSAFNNAGFSLMNNNLVNFVHDPVINITITALIILGGLGYPVLIAIYIYCQRFFKSRRKQALKELADNVSGIASKIQIKIALFGTLFFLFFGTVLIYWIEYDNTFPEHDTFFYHFFPAWFQSVTARTAGFNTLDIGSLHAPTLLLLMIFMFIGANPAGTAGGVKIPTIAVLYGYIKDWFAAPDQPVILMGERVSRFAVSHAIRLFFFSTAFVVITTAVITYIERDYVITTDNIFGFTKILFETTSAFSTTGLSMGYEGGVTSFSGLFSIPSKYLIVITMLFGRIGPLIVLAALPWKRKYADEKSTDFNDVQNVRIG